MYKNICDNSSDGMLVMQGDTFIYCNNALMQLLSYSSREKLLACSIEDFSPEYQEDGTLSSIKAQKLIETVLSLGSANSEWTALRADGTKVCVSLSLTKIEHENSKCILSQWRDISKRKELEKELHESQYFFEAIYRCSHDAIAVLDMSSRFLQVNPAYIEMTGMSEEELLATSCIELSAPEDIERSKNAIKKVLEVGYIKSYEKRCIFNNGMSVDVDMTISLLDNPQRLLLSVRDITEKKRKHKELLEHKALLHYQAHHDVLTGLPNRILFHDRLSQSIEKAKRSETKVALLFIDLDHFKEINDSMGHSIGDDILQTVTQRFLKTLRKEDTLARLGGDEFCVLLEGISDTQDASYVAQKLLESITEPVWLAQQNMYLSASIGISLYPDDGFNSENLLQYADSAMYSAKRQGRNRFEYYTQQMTSDVIERVFLESSLREALNNREFIVYYQAQIDASNHNIVGMEALVRWNHSSMGIISPGKFIPLAESTGLIVELDRQVMHRAMLELSQWYKEGLCPGKLSLNLSIKQLASTDFITYLEKTLKDTGCKPEWIELEITEGEVMDKPQEAILSLNKISALGIKLSIDDFGTGYSSFTYLKRLPLDKLKIDQSFVKNLPEDEEDAGITKAVIALSKSLKLEVIAEGVEKESQELFLINNGCDLIQGYLYSKPIPHDEFRNFLINFNKKGERV